MYNVCGVSGYHKFDRHVHEIHGHKATASSEHAVERDDEHEDHEQKPEQTGIWQVYLMPLLSVVYKCIAHRDLH